MAKKSGMSGKHHIKADRTVLGSSHFVCPIQWGLVQFSLLQIAAIYLLIRYGTYGRSVPPTPISISKQNKKLRKLHAYPKGLHQVSIQKPAVNHCQAGPGGKDVKYLWVTQQTAHMPLSTHTVKTLQGQSLTISRDSSLPCLYAQLLPPANTGLTSFLRPIGLS